MTAIRVLVIVLISTLIWVPIGVWIGLQPNLAKIVQPSAQFLAAFPANVLFPLFVMLIVTFHLNVEVWTTPLMLLGTQWYILFNVIAGTAALPKDLRQVADNFGVTGWYMVETINFTWHFSILHYRCYYCCWQCLEYQCCC